MPKTKNEVIRITVSLPTEYHDALENLITQNKISIAWVVRDAIKKYLARIVDTNTKTNNLKDE